MTQLNDCRYDALIAQGFTGHTNDMLLAWAQSNGATSNQLNDALLESLLLNGAISNCLSDAWYEALGTLGISGSRNDRELTFWCDFGGAFALQAIAGWTGAENCSSTPPDTHTIRFNKPITFVDHTGVSFVNITTAETVSSITRVDEASPSAILTYTDVVWTNPPLSGELVEFRYDGLGNYQDAEGTPMEAQVFTLTDCLLVSNLGLNDGNQLGLTNAANLLGLTN